MEPWQLGASPMSIIPEYLLSMSCPFVRTNTHHKVFHVKHFVRTILPRPKVETSRARVRTPHGQLPQLNCSRWCCRIRYTGNNYRSSS
jgi:hypothetical protein